MLRPTELQYPRPFINICHPFRVLFVWTKTLQTASALAQGQSSRKS